MQKFAYVPIDRLHTLAHLTTLPDRTRGTALYADISGFTALAERLHRAFGSRRGAEELSSHIDAVFSLLIDPVHHYGGSVVAFSGDAITCWFDQARLAEPALAAATAALHQQTALRDAAAFRLPDGNSIAPQIKVALASGRARRFVVGDPTLQSFDLLAGTTILRLAHVEALAQPGDVLLDHATWQSLGARAEIEAVRCDPGGSSGYPRLVGLTQAAEPQPWEIPLSFPDAALGSWLPPSVNARLDAGLGEFLTELRPASVLFAQFGTIDVDADGSDVQLARFIRRAHAVIAQLDGTLLQITIGEKGSFLYAAFGAPIMHEDDATRAVRAALALRALRHELPFLPTLHIGLAQGKLRAGAYGSPSRRTYGVLGDEVNLAARLMQSAGHDGIVASEAICAATRHAFAWESLAPLRVKGKADLIPVARLQDATDQKLSSNRQAPSSRPLIGRSGERAVLAEALGALARGQGTTIVIEGEAGIGKSRLVADLLEQAQLRGFHSLVGHSDAITQTTPYHPWQPIFTSLLSPDPAELHPHQLLLTALRTHPRIAPWLALLDIVVPLEQAEGERSVSLVGEARAEQTLTVLSDLIALSVATQPLVLVLEDAHWMDSASWKLAHRVSQQTGPLLLLLVTRPPDKPLGTPYAQLLGAATARHLRLEPLATTESLALVCERLGVTQLPDVLATLIQEKTEGHPFFAEEFALALRDTGFIRIRAGVCELAVPPAALRTTTFPDTLHGVVTSRIDQLPPTQQLTLKVASVIGRVFEVANLRAIFPLRQKPLRLTDDLHVLERLDLTPLVTPPPDPAYRFKHVITQEAAYSLLLFAQRRALHAAVAAWYERTLPDEQLTARAGQLAHHWGEAERTDKTIMYLERAGNHALRNGIYREAALFFERALALRTAGTGQEAVEQAHCERLLAEALLGLGQMRASLDHALRALALLGVPIADPFFVGGVAQAASTVWGLAQVTRREGRPARPADVERMEAYLICWRVAYYDSDARLVVYTNLQAVLLAAQEHLPHRALFFVGAGFLAGYVGLTPVANRFLQRAGQTARALNDPTQTALTLLLTGIYHSGRGSWARSHQYLSAARSLLEEQRDWRSWTDAVFGRAFNWYYQGDLVRSRAAFQLVAQVARARSGGQPAAGAVGGQGLIALRQGELEHAVALLEETAATAGAALIEINAYGTLALAALRLGRLGVARAAADAAAERIARTTPVSFIAVEGYAGMAEVYLALWRQALDDRQLAARAHWACQTLRWLSRAFPIAQPQAWWCQGTYDWINGRERQALRAWQTSFRRAEQLAMPYEQGRALTELAVHLPLAHVQRQGQSEQAAARFRRIGAVYDLRDLGARCCVDAAQPCATQGHR